jgi:hypothetical protein
VEGSGPNADEHHLLRLLVDGLETYQKGALITPTTIELPVTTPTVTPSPTSLPPPAAQASPSFTPKPSDEDIRRANEIVYRQLGLSWPSPSSTPSTPNPLNENEKLQEQNDLSNLARPRSR